MKKIDTNTPAGVLLVRMLVGSRPGPRDVPMRAAVLADNRDSPDYAREVSIGRAATRRRAQAAARLRRAGAHG